MKKLVLTGLLGAACLGLAGCGGGEDRNASAGNATTEAEGGEAAMGGEAGANASGAAAGAAASGSFPKGARIVEEGGVTYRIDADGTRVKLGDTDSRIVVENGVRYRVDPGGTRVRINERGLDIDVDAPDVDLPDVDLPDVDAGINKKGNLDVDVKNKKDGNDGPN